jgi:hypothetical protein
VVLVSLGAGSCGTRPGEPAWALVDRELAVVNVSQNQHLILEFEIAGEPVRTSPRIPPSAVFRRAFGELFGTACPPTLTVRAYVYDVDPGGGDPEVPDPAAEDEPPLTLVASAETTVSPCPTPSATAYVLTLREDPVGPAAIVFNSSSLQWFLSSVAIEAPAAMPDPIPNDAIEGMVVTPENVPVSGIEVVLRRVVREVGQPCAELSAESSQLIECEPGTLPTPEKERGAVVSMAASNALGRFEFSAPAGLYVAEVFADGYQFRPAETEFESPRTNLTFIAEPTPSDAEEQ